MYCYCICARNLSYNLFIQSLVPMPSIRAIIYIQELEPSIGANSFITQVWEQVIRTTVSSNHSKYRIIRRNFLVRLNSFVFLLKTLHLSNSKKCHGIQIVKNDVIFSLSSNGLRVIKPEGPGPKVNLLSGDYSCST